MVFPSQLSVAFAGLLQRQSACVVLLWLAWVWQPDWNITLSLADGEQSFLRDRSLIGAVLSVDCG